jgi:hypothetical protein
MISFALALWNEHDPILKERIFGLTGNEGNHGEDSKEYYFYFDSTPSHSYMKYLYKYPQAEFPYVKQGTIRPNSASCFWKSACWIRRISEAPQGATTFL